MYDFLKENVKNVCIIVSVMIVTQTVFFIIFSYLMCGDAFLALRNFYYLTYNIQI